MDTDFSRPRVNAEMLTSCIGKNVCLLGIAKNVDSKGTTLTMTTGDGKDIQVSMQEPLQEYVSGLTEIHGKVNQQGTGVVCEHYVLFPEQTSKTFDLDLYNQTVQLMSRMPDRYQIGVRG